MLLLLSFSNNESLLSLLRERVLYYGCARAQKVSFCFALLVSGTTLRFEWAFWVFLSQNWPFKSFFLEEKPDGLCLGSYNDSYLLQSLMSSDVSAVLFLGVYAGPPLANAGPDANLVIGPSVALKPPCNLMNDLELNLRKLRIFFLNQKHTLLIMHYKYPWY